MSSVESSPRFAPLPTEDSFIPSLAIVLTHLVSLAPANNEGHITNRNRFACFKGVVPPAITVRKYLARIARYFGCSNECFVLSLVYIDRIVKLHDGFVVSILNIHRLLITSVMLAAKFFDDVYFSNTFYARVGGVGTQEMNLLETQFLSLINYQLFVSAEEYDQYRHNVQAAVQSSATFRNSASPLQVPTPPPALPNDGGPYQNWGANDGIATANSAATVRRFQSASKHGNSPKENSQKGTFVQLIQRKMRGQVFHLYQSGVPQIMHTVPCPNFQDTPAHPALIMSHRSSCTANLSPPVKQPMDMNHSRMMGNHVAMAHGNSMGMHVNSSNHMVMQNTAHEQQPYQANIIHSGDRMMMKQPAQKHSGFVPLQTHKVEMEGIMGEVHPFEGMPSDYEANQRNMYSPKYFMDIHGNECMKRDEHWFHHRA